MRYFVWQNAAHADKKERRKGEKAVSKICFFRSAKLQEFMFCYHLCGDYVWKQIPEKTHEFLIHEKFVRFSYCVWRYLRLLRKKQPTVLCVSEKELADVLYMCRPMFVGSSRWFCGTRNDAKSIKTKPYKILLGKRYGHLEHRIGLFALFSTGFQVCDSSCHNLNLYRQVQSSQLMLMILRCNFHDTAGLF